MEQQTAPHEGVLLFELADRAGKTHKYESTMFGLDGIDLAVEVRAMAAEPIARVLTSVGALQAIMGKLQADGLETDIEAMFGEVIKAEIPWVEVAKDIKTAFQSAGGSDLIRKILARTYRDGKPLSDDRNLGKAYGRNWNEMFIAAYRIAQWNDLLGFTLTSTSNSVEGAADGSQASAPALSA